MRNMLIKAAAGATAVFIIGTGASYAAGGDSNLDATNKTVATVTVNGYHTLALTKSGGTVDAADFTVSGTMDRSTGYASGALTQAGTPAATFTLAYATDYLDKITATASLESGQDLTLGADYVTLKVTPGSVTTNAGTAALTSAGELAAVATPATLATMSGNLDHVDGSFPLAFAAMTGTKAVIGAHSATITYTILANP